jgi:hypothetical protein
MRRLVGDIIGRLTTTFIWSPDCRVHLRVCAALLPGVTVAKEVELEDPVENVGAKLVRQAAQKTNDQAGDGTTTATVLSAAMITEVGAAAPCAP